MIDSEILRKLWRRAEVEMWLDSRNIEQSARPDISWHHLTRDYCIATATWCQKSQHDRILEGGHGQPQTLYHSSSMAMQETHGIMSRRTMRLLHEQMARKRSGQIQQSFAFDHREGYLFLFVGRHQQSRFISLTYVSVTENILTNDPLTASVKHKMSYLNSIVGGACAYNENRTKNTSWTRRMFARTLFPESTVF